MGAEVAKTAKSKLNCLFVYFFYFVVPSAAVGKYKGTKPYSHDKFDRTDINH